MAGEADRRGKLAAVGEELLAQLAGQIGSAERMLELLVAQGRAIRSRDALAVVRTVGALQGELARREELERERQGLLERTAAIMGVPLGNLTLSAICAELPSALAERARRRAAELRGLVDKLQREHAVNRALMGVELAFLDHLLSELHGAQTAAYEQTGQPSRARQIEELHLLDMEA